MKRLGKKQFIKLIILAVSFLLAREIFSNWEHFKAGLFGTPIENTK
ncbi:MAG: hypothetical protein ABJH05_05280 [Fulvivirga sp.]